MGEKLSEFHVPQWLPKRGFCRYLVFVNYVFGHRYVHIIATWPHLSTLAPSKHSAWCLSGPAVVRGDFRIGKIAAVHDNFVWAVN